MNKISCLFCSIVFICSCMNAQQFYFDKPASIWEESIPLGNGRIGLMPWGDIEQERIVLNEISLWSGGKQNADNPASYQYLDSIRGLLFQKENKKAQDLMYKTFTCLGQGSTDNTAYGNFQNFGNLYIEFTYPEANSSISDYRRILDIQNAIATTSFTKNDIEYRRDFFTSFTSDVGVIRLTANKEKSINASFYLQRDENVTISASGNILKMEGQMRSSVSDGMKYCGFTKVLPKGGKMRTLDNKIIVENADEVLLIISLATNYSENNAEIFAKKLLEKTDNDFNSLKEHHTDTYRKLYDRVEISLPKNRNSDLPIDKRLKALENDNSDADLSALYMQYGRYLLISSTRQGSLPPNLQGLWAHQIYTPWNGDYHLNINLQMNHWITEIGNLSELHLPLVNWVKSIVPSGEKTARTYYNSRGWVTHILGNVWGFTSPSEDPSWGATNTAGAWLCRHLWEHYEYSEDKQYLKDIYPTIKGAALFFSDMLIEDPNSGFLVTAPTTSPENTYISHQGDSVSISLGSTMDNQLVRELFTNAIAAAKILKTDNEFICELEAKKARISPNRIGKYGQIMEWIDDYEEVDVHHRHISQLYGLHPSNEITEETPDLMHAAKATLERRGDISTGWSMAWKINFWARLKDGERAYKLICDLLKPAGNTSGTYPNLFSAHPPMQIDGNFGASAGVMEMLLQSHAGYIDFLPALPYLWKDGHVKGLKVRGGGIVDIEWKENEVKTIVLQSETDHQYALMIDAAKIKETNYASEFKTEKNLLLLNLLKGQRVTMKF